MEPYEVRIHYAANNTVREDTRWMRIAQGTANFKPTRRFQLSDTIIGVSELEPLPAKNASQSQNSTQPITISSQSELNSQSQPFVIENAEAVPEAILQRVAKRKASISSEDRSPDAAKRTKRTSFARTKKGLNPAFKNPIAGYMRTRKSSRSSPKTPRPQSTPEATVVVPVTKSPKRRRSPPNLDRAEDSVEQTSSPDRFETSCIDETSVLENSAHLQDSVKAASLAESHHSTDSYSFEIKYLGNQEQLHRSDPRVPQPIGQDQDTSLPLFHEDFGDIELNMGTRIAPSVDENRPETPITTTATPSNIDDYIDNSSPLAQKSTGNNYTPLIDLTSPPDNNLPQVTRRDVLGPVSSPIPIGEESTSPHAADVTARYTEIKALPKRIMCNTKHTIKSRPFESLLPQYLSDLADGFGLVNHFRPVLAPISIRNGERGYWNLRIRISDMATVARSRRSPLTSSQWSDKRFMMRQEGSLPEAVSTAEGNEALRQLVYPNLDPETYTLWTLDEFKTFWAYLTKVVEGGRAGYDVRATLKCSEPNLEDLSVEVKLYGYAETLSHLWLVLYGVSSTLTAAMPLQWCVPGAGPLITMSGQPKRGGVLGRWLPKRDGLEGSWGLEDDWDGLDSARNLAEGSKQ